MPELNVKERVSLVKMISIASTGFADRITLEALKKELDFSEKEAKELGIRDVELGQGRIETTWDPIKAEKKGKQTISLTKDRDKAIRRMLINLSKRVGGIFDGFSEKLFDLLSWKEDDLKALSSIVDAMDKEEVITEGNFELCKKIKEKAGTMPEKEAE
jgi:predicted transcriptional regulator